MKQSEMKIMEKFLYIILNRTSGSGKASEIEAILKTLENKYQFTVEIKDTQFAKHAGLLAREFAEEAKRCAGQPIIVAMGGDGTLSEVVNGLGEDFNDIPVSFIPFGSGNDFARSEHIPLKPLNAVIHLLETEEATYQDILKFEDLLRSQIYYSVNSIGFGLDGRIGHEKNKNAMPNKNRSFQFSKYSYLSSLSAAYRSQEPFSLTIKTNEKEWHFNDAILQLNANRPFFGGGLKIASKASSEDKLIDVLVLKKCSLVALMRLVFLLLAGKGKHLNDPHVHFLQLDEYELSVSSSQYGQVDGENLNPIPQYCRFSTVKRAFWL